LFIVTLPIFGATNQIIQGVAMAQDNEILEVADLEYEVGSVHSIEAGDGQNSNEVVIIYYMPPV
jgi:hypothetical protein